MGSLANWLKVIMMGSPEEVKPADRVTVKEVREVDGEGKPLGGRNEDYGPDAETPSVLNYHRGGRTEAFGPGAETPRLVQYY